MMIGAHVVCDLSGVWRLLSSSFVEGGAQKVVKEVLG